MIKKLNSKLYDVVEMLTIDAIDYTKIIDTYHIIMGYFSAKLLSKLIKRSYYIGRLILSQQLNL
ncbi:hypothetical protein [Caldisphaera lagunensis]|uniref:hypothetical protein n=1 Tax=Caldisphaera lagunensis TaxID=200415 RepID=UPI0012FA2690|nr:hypothetical protein [Caldisphaera lagunensis]